MINKSGIIYIIYIILYYDPKNNASIWREYMRILIKIDVRKPLKRKKKITRKNGNDFVVHCKYERLGDLCFKCGMISHTERSLKPVRIL